MRSRRPQTILLLLFSISLFTPALADPAPQRRPPEGFQVDDEGEGQVTISPSPEANATETGVPITATIFNGVPGPKSCRGRVMRALSIPPPPTGGGRTGSRCYNLPRPAGCGNFVAGKDAGCEARLFSERDCAVYINTAVFVPEDKDVGGMWRSFSVECGLPTPDPDSLGAPPLQDMVENAKRPSRR